MGVRLLWLRTLLPSLLLQLSAILRLRPLLRRLLAAALLLQRLFLSSVSAVGRLVRLSTLPGVGLAWVSWLGVWRMGWTRMGLAPRVAALVAPTTATVVRWHL